MVVLGGILGVYHPRQMMVVKGGGRVVLSVGVPPTNHPHQPRPLPAQESLVVVVDGKTPREGEPQTQRRNAMKKMLHTPGPWMARGSTRIKCSGGPTECLLVFPADRSCDIAWLPFRPDARANQALIAAAPDMLAALIKIQELVKDEQVQETIARAIGSLYDE